jgi:hypothetical protein
VKRLSSWREGRFFDCVHELNRKLTHRLPSRWELLALKLWWGNPGYSAGTAYLIHLCRAIREGRGGILECGSGLSTIIGGLVARRAGRPWVALENHGPTRRRLRHLLAALALSEITLVAAPIVGYEGYDWYRVPTEFTEAVDFDLVVCDGPPWHTRGGRFGLLPAMGARLGPGCRILLDDAYRPAEKRAIRRWKELVDLEVRLLGRPLTYADISLNT